MRNLYEFEMTQVGGGCSPEPCYCPEPEPTPRRKAKRNNGFGNGADEDRSAPGNSGKTGGGKEGSFGDERGER